MVKEIVLMKIDVELNRAKKALEESNIGMARVLLNILVNISHPLSFPTCLPVGRLDWESITITEIPAFAGMTLPLLFPIRRHR